MGYNQQYQNRNKGGAYSTRNLGQGVSSELDAEIARSTAELDKIQHKRQQIVDMCSHKPRNQNDLSSLGLDSEGNEIFRCNRCRKTFTVKNQSKEDVARKVEEMISLIDVSRLLGPNMPNDVNKCLTEAITALRQVPKVFEMYILNRLATTGGQQYQDKRGYGSSVPSVNRGNFMGNGINGSINNGTNPNGNSNFLDDLISREVCDNGTFNGRSSNAPFVEEWNMSDI